MTRRLAAARLVALALILGWPCAARAVDGVIEINHARALAGGVTPGDAPGYPVDLKVPGSYRLTGNLAQPDDKTIVIAVGADGVSIDLNGFSIRGPMTCVAGYDAQHTFVTAVTCNGGNLSLAPGILAISTSSVSVSNGKIVGIAGPAFSLGPNSRVEQVEILDCSNGAAVKSGSTVKSLRINRSRGGIRVDGGGALLEDITVFECDASGGVLVSASSSIMNRITVTSSAGSGILAGEGSRLTDSLARRLSEDGIAADALAMVSGCISTYNHREGFFFDADTVQWNNTVARNDGGMFGLWEQGVMLGDGVCEDLHDPGELLPLKICPDYSSQQSP